MATGEGVPWYNLPQLHTFQGGLADRFCTGVGGQGGSLEPILETFQRRLDRISKKNSEMGIMIGSGADSKDENS